MISRIHVNQHVIKFNREHDTDLPVYTVKQGGNTYYGREVVIHGESKMVHGQSHPLSCGAVAWLYTEAPVTIVDEVRWDDILQKMQEVK